MPFMELRTSLLDSQEPAMDPYPEPHESSPVILSNTWKSNEGCVETMAESST